MKSIKMLGIIALALTAQSALAHGEHHHGHHHHGQNAATQQNQARPAANTITEQRSQRVRPQRAQRQERCRAITQDEVAALFDRWNASLATGQPKAVVANYDAESILLPTLSNKPRLTAAEKEDYFVHFLENQPQGRIDQRHIQIGCNTALDAGLYTFTFAKNGQSASGRYSYTYRWNGKEWLITHHHSSLMPETGNNAAH